MLLKKLGLGVAAAALTFAATSAANAATVIHVGAPNFQITSGTPFTPTITAAFFDGFGASGSFDDIFEFTIPTQSGVGSGSISTSFAGDATKLTITDLIINGTSYAVTTTSSGQSATVNGIKIMAGVKNTIEVIGTVAGSGSFGGNATFQAVVPEPGTWAMMVTGLGMLGFALRRRSALTLA